MPANIVVQLVRTLAVLLVLFLVPAQPLVAGGAGEEEAAAREKLDQASERSLAEQAERAEVEREIAATRRQVQELTAKLAVLSRRLADDRASSPRIFSVTTSARAGIGIVVRTDSDMETDQVGATVVAITPGGPAEEAGLEPGDVITRFNDIKLVEAPGRAGSGESAPAIRLIERARQLSEGDKVRLVYVRDGKERDVEIRAVPLPASPFGGNRQTFVIRTGEPNIKTEFAFVPRWTAIGFREFDNLELVELNPDLGGYFGVKDGVLVVQAPPESLFKIRPGDVLLKVGEFRPRTPQEAFEVLHTHEPGKPITIQVLRKGDKIELTSLLPVEETSSPARAPRSPRKRD